MADFSGIQAVSSTLRELLMTRMAEPAEITVAGPDLDDAPDGPWVNLFLYRVSENAEVKNQDLPGRAGPMSLGRPPLSLDLHYVLTAEGLDPDDQRGAHRVLGDAMLVLHDHPVIPKDDPVLDPVLQSEVELLKVTLDPVGVEQLANLWTATTAAFRLSAAYKVTVVQLESTRPRVLPKPVLEPPAAGPRVHAVPIDRPRIARVGVVRPPATEEAPVPYARIGDTLVLHGSRLHPGIRVLLGEVDATPDILDTSTAGILRVTIPDHPALQAGVQRLQVIRDVQIGEPPRELPLMRSNVAVFVVVPEVAGVTPASGPSGATVTIEGRRLVADSAPTLAVFGDRPYAPQPGATDTEIRVVLSGLAAGEHPVSVRVGAAESIDAHTFEVRP